METAPQIPHDETDTAAYYICSGWAHPGFGWAHPGFSAVCAVDAMFTGNGGITFNSSLGTAASGFLLVTDVVMHDFASWEGTPVGVGSSFQVFTSEGAWRSAQASHLL